MILLTMQYTHLAILYGDCVIVCLLNGIILAAFLHKKYMQSIFKGVLVCITFVKPWK